jgi:hypothetical protein
LRGVGHIGIREVEGGGGRRREYVRDAITSALCAF